MNIHSGQLKSGPWLLEASRHEAADDGWQQADWRNAPDYGAFNSTSRPPTSADIPHPSQLKLSKSAAARVAASQDPENDPYGVLNDSGKTFEDLVNNVVSHHNKANEETNYEGRVWYPAAHEYTKDLAQKTSGNHNRVAAEFASLSPQNDWDNNIEHGTHFALHYNGDPNFTMPRILPANVEKAMALRQADPSQYDAILNGPKTRSFYHNIIDSTPLRQGRPGEHDDEGYFQHGINPHTNEEDWRLNPDQDVTADTHHARAASTPHGADLADARYQAPADFGYVAASGGTKYEPGYDLYNRATQEATRRVNAAQPDTARHLTPKQMQAIVWTKFKEDVDNAGSGRDFNEPGVPTKGLQKALDKGKTEEEWAQKNPLTNAIPRYQRERDPDYWTDEYRRPNPDIRSAPGYLRASAVANNGSLWGKVLGSYIAKYPQHPEATAGPQHGPHPAPRRTLAPRKPRRPRKSSWYLTADFLSGGSDAPFAGTFGNAYTSGTGGAWAAAHPPGFSVPSSGGSGGGGSGTPTLTSPSSSSSSSSGASSQAAAPVTRGTGLAAATSLAQGANGMKYDWGGHGPGTGSMGSYDCSGFQSAIYNSLTGKNERFVTDSNFKNLGFQPGYDPNSKFNIGTYGSGENGHMVGQLNGTKVESNDSGGVQYGGKATGPLDSPHFSNGLYHLPDSMIVNSQPDTGTAPGQVTSRRQGGWYITADEKDEDETTPQVSTTTSGNPGSGTPVAAPGSSPSVAPSQAATPMGNGQLGVLPSLPQVNWGNMPDVKMGPVAAPNHPSPSGSAGGGGGHGPASPVSVVSPSVGGSGAPVAYSPSAGVEQWNDQVNQALQRNDLPLSLAPNVKKQIGSESSGNPNAINRVDSNAQAGHPSQGLLQTIPGTFNQYHHPGDSTSITDPQANLDAAIGYAKSRYGPTLMNSQGVGIGSGHGYDDGGFLPPGHTHAINNTGEPELVIPLKYLRHLIHSGHRKSGAYLLQASEHLEFHTPYDEHPIDDNWHAGNEIVHPWHPGDEKHMASQPKSGPYLLEASRHYADDGDIHDDPLIGNTHTPKHRQDDMQDQEFTASRWYV